MRGTDDGRRMAVQTVRERMRVARIFNGEQLAKLADLNADTVSDFLNGRRWPRPGSLAKIEAALEIPAGSLDALADENEAFVEAHAAAPPSAKTLTEASDVELLLALLTRATARLGEDNASNGN